MEWKTAEDLRSGSCLGWPPGPIDFRHVDPYILWADASGFRGTARAGGTGQCPPVVPAIVHMQAPPVVQPAAQPLAGSGPIPLMAVGPAYRPTQDSWPSYFTATVTPNQFVNLKPGRTFNVPMMVGVFPWVSIVPMTFTVDLRATLGLTRVAASEAALRLALNVPGNLASTDPATPVLAIIDDCCPFANACVRDPRKVASRVRFLWDQGEELPANSEWWTKPVDFSYGRELTGGNMERLMQGPAAGPDGTVLEDACYVLLGHDAEGATFRHGAAVMGLAAGSPSPLDDPEHPSAVPDAAGQAPIIFVQLPRQTMQDTSGGSLAVHVLDALRYIDARTTERDSQNRPVARTPVVVNISLGASAGPHDGTSLIEEAINEFIGSRDNCMVVVAAGNARDVHSRAKIGIGAGRTRTLTLQVPPDQSNSTFMEAWLPADEDEAQPYQVSVRLVPPGGDPALSPWVEPGRAAFAVEANTLAVATAVAGVVNSAGAPNGENGAMALVAVGPTASDGEADRPLCEPGLWQVDFRNEGATDVEVDCWIERDDGRQAEFFDPDYLSVRREVTLASLANGERSLVIGGFRCSDRQLSEYSGEGPGRAGVGRVGPDAIGVADESETLPGVLTNGVHSGEFVRLRGTSAAAALATRRVYNQLAASLPKPQTWQAIKATFRNSVNEPRDPLHEAETRVGAGKFLP